MFNVKDENNSSQEKNSKKKFLIRGYKLSQFYLIILNVAIVILLIANLITQNKLKTRFEMAIKTYLSTIALNVSGLNAPVERYKVADWIKKTRAYTMLPT